MPGRVFRLYTARFHDGVMPRYDTPEMLRLSLDAVCLKVRRHCLVRVTLSAPPSALPSSVQVKLLGIRTGDAPLEARKPGSPPAAVASSAKAILAMSIQVRVWRGRWEYSMWTMGGKTGLLSSQVREQGGA